MRLLLLLPALVILTATALIAQAEQPPTRSASAGSYGVSVFGVEARGSKFLYVFDRSGSMSEPQGKPLAAAKVELCASVDELKDVQQFYLITYNHEPKLLDIAGVRGRLTFATDANKEAAKKLINELKADGGTNHEAAMALALKMRPDVIFLLTDGDSNDDLSAEELARLGRLNYGAIVNVIQFSDPIKGENRLVKLAHESGGEHVYVDLLNFKRKSAAK